MSRKAYWIQHSHLFGGDEFECSACGFCADRPYTSCPNCGRQMGRPKYDPSWVDEMEADDIFEDGF